ncbi:hypothetical protein ABF87_10565 [Nitrosomonas sp. JL21]|nr:hypothetical protein [Nitrosomonas sp. JL21]
MIPSNYTGNTSSGNGGAISTQVFVGCLIGSRANATKSRNVMNRMLGMLKCASSRNVTRSYFSSLKPVVPCNRVSSDWNH